jgi:hypothetical protein
VGTKIWVIAGLIAGLASAAAAQEGVAPYDGLRAGEEAHAIGEAQRRQRLNDQLYLNDAMRARYGWSPAAGSVVWYGNAAGYGRPLGIDYAYAYSSNRLPGRRAGGLYIERYWSPPATVFEPWPYVPGDIYGYHVPPYVRQSIGQRQIQTGPNRWESHPVYADELAPAEPALEPEMVEPEMEAPPPAPEVEERGQTEKPAAKKPRRYYF